MVAIFMRVSERKRGVILTAGNGIAKESPQPMLAATLLQQTGCSAWRRWTMRPAIVQGRSQRQPEATRLLRNLPLSDCAPAHPEAVDAAMEFQLANDFPWTI